MRAHSPDTAIAAELCRHLVRLFGLHCSFFFPDICQFMKRQFLPWCSLARLGNLLHHDVRRRIGERHASLRHSHTKRIAMHRIATYAHTFLGTEWLCDCPNIENAKPHPHYALTHHMHNPHTITACTPHTTHITHITHTNPHTSHTPHSHHEHTHTHNSHTHHTPHHTHTTPYTLGLV